MLCGEDVVNGKRRRFQRFALPPRWAFGPLPPLAAFSHSATAPAGVLCVVEGVLPREEESSAPAFAAPIVSRHPLILQLIVVK